MKLPLSYDLTQVAMNEHKKEDFAKNKARVWFCCKNLTHFGALE